MTSAPWAVSRPWVYWIWVPRKDGDLVVGADFCRFFLVFISCFLVFFLFLWFFLVFFS